MANQGERNHKVKYGIGAKIVGVYLDEDIEPSQTGNDGVRAHHSVWVFFTSLGNQKSPFQHRYHHPGSV
jgi:hypothetical protein